MLSLHCTAIEIILERKELELELELESEMLNFGGDLREFRLVTLPGSRFLYVRLIEGETKPEFRSFVSILVKPWCRYVLKTIEGVFLLIVRCQ